MILSLAAFIAASSAAVPEAVPDVAQPVPRTEEFERVLPQPEVAMQVSIRQRVIIRVPRQRGAAGQVSFSAPAEPRKPVRYVEKKMKQCVPITSLLAVTPAKSKSIDLVTRDRQRIRAHLDGGCTAADFHAGLYIERSKDGDFCAERDILIARSGMKCEVDRLRMLVPEDE